MDLNIYAKTIETEAYNQIMAMASHPMFKNTKIRIMPDTHAGKGCTIGTSYTISDFVVPSHVGVDIGCSVSTITTSIKANPADYATIERRIKSAVPMGMNIHNETKCDEKALRGFLRASYDTARSAWPEMILPGMDFTERGLEKWCQRIGMDSKVFYHSLGTVGGGNHFVELGVDKWGCYAITFHCGSRNLGVKVCKYWESKSRSNGVGSGELNDAIERIKATATDRRQIPEMIQKAKDELMKASAPNGFLTGDGMRGYLTDMVIAQAYAKYNHYTIGSIILDIMKGLYGRFDHELIYTTHNYINMNDHILRKGAVSAREGEKFVLPFNMRDGIAICVGKGNDDWNQTAPHGAGRLMSRTAAKNNLSMEEFKAEMSGIVTTTVCRNTIDESPMAYKDKDEIVEFIKPTCRIVEFIKPIINIKNTDGNE